MNDPQNKMSFRLQTETACDAAASAEPATILVVDDYRSLCDMTAAMLRRQGYRVLTASGGEEAKAFVHANGEIDLLLTDLEMPQMRGDELAAWFRAAKPATRILFMSAKRAELAGLDPLEALEKPFRAEVLIEKVRALLHQNFSPSAQDKAA